MNSNSNRGQDVHTSYPEEKFEADNVIISMAYTANEDDIELIFSYARHGRKEEIEKLLNRGIPVDVRDNFGNTLLITACQNGNKAIAKLVLRRGANINARNFKGLVTFHAKI